MPALEMAQETGKLIAWRKKEGDRVAKGRAPARNRNRQSGDGSGSARRRHSRRDQSVRGADIPVGQTIAWIVAPGEAPPVESESAMPAARAGSHSPASPVKDQSHAAPAQDMTQAPGSSAKISPKARRLAKELGVDIAALRGSGAEAKSWPPTFKRPPQRRPPPRLRRNPQTLKFLPRSAASWLSAPRRVGPPSRTSL
jgi:pyruvate dehydrogenase E2 component (dihydrolipoamide acetyltransferase)